MTLYDTHRKLGRIIKDLQDLQKGLGYPSTKLRSFETELETWRYLIGCDAVEALRRKLPKSQRGP